AGEQQAPQGLAPEQAVALPLELVGRGLQLGDLVLAGARVLGVGDGLGGAPVVDLGVGLAVGDALHVGGDQAGVGLGLGARRDLLAGEADQVGPAVVPQAGRVGER